ncbi:MAG: hypothetical protein CTY34_08270 [Methylobacter sp.]|nr:MAG: hypothetical protein CTY34_08270 [Methylobacter sp.]PPD02604.1 MAG: hypothetical protein CTY29_12465 [Methylobacter sp.]
MFSYRSFLNHFSYSERHTKIKKADGDFFYLIDIIVIIFYFLSADENLGIKAIIKYDIKK